MPTRAGTRAATLTANETAFLANPFVGVVTTVRPNGSLHSTVVWIDHDEEHVLFNTARRRAKPRRVIVQVEADHLESAGLD